MASSANDVGPLRFAHQDTLLDKDDVAAIACCPNEVDGYGSCNRRAQARANQSHKHLQMVPVSMRCGTPDHSP